MEVISRNEVEPFTTKDSAEIRGILAPTNSSIVQQSLAEATLAPGMVTEEHFHPKAEEIYYVLDGRGRMQVEDEARDVRPGDGIAILPGKRHIIWNIGGSDLIFLCCCSPAYSHDNTVIVE